MDLLDNGIDLIDLSSIAKFFYYREQSLKRTFKEPLCYLNVMRGYMLNPYSIICLFCLFVPHTLVLTLSILGDPSG